MYSHCFQTDDYFSVIKEGEITHKYRIKKMYLRDVSRDNLKALLIAKKAYYNIQMKMMDKGFGYQRPNVHFIYSSETGQRLKYVENKLHRGMNIMNRFKQGQPLPNVS